MLTVRHLERLWNARRYPQLLQELIVWRVEAPLAGDLGDQPAIASAALALVRLDELHQSHVPLAGKLCRALIAAQQPSGGWGSAMLTSLCLRALMLDHGSGVVIERGLAYLASLQQGDGLWPRIAGGRMPSDALTSAFVLLQLGDQEPFRLAVRFDDACEYFEMNRAGAQAAAKALWSHARLRNASRDSLFLLS